MPEQGLLSTGAPWPAPPQNFSSDHDRARLSGPALKAFDRIARAWGLTNPEAAALLGMSPSTWDRARRGTRMRVATKYLNLTRGFFAARHVTDYRIVESLGATEGAPAAGAAELIVDITTTGATLAANALKILDDGVILRSEANLVASLAALWDDAARETARGLLSRIAAEEAARTTREVSTTLPSVPAEFFMKAEAAFAARRRRQSPDSFVSLSCPKDKVAALADWLIAQGAGDVTVTALDYVFSATNPLYEKLLARLP